jgi:hypothetical protein
MEEKNEIILRGRRWKKVGTTPHKFLRVRKKAQ